LKTYESNKSLKDPGPPPLSTVLGNTAGDRLAWTLLITLHIKGHWGIFGSNLVGGAVDSKQHHYMSVHTPEINQEGMHGKVKDGEWFLRRNNALVHSVKILEEYRRLGYFRQVFCIKHFFSLK